MAKTLMLSSVNCKSLACLLLLVLTLGCVNSARLLDQVDPQPPVLPDAPPIVAPGDGLPSGQTPATVPTGDAPLPDVPVPDAVAPVPTPVDNTLPLPTPPQPDVLAPNLDNIPPPAATPLGSGPIVGASATGSPGAPLSFFMHDILGGTHPSARVVTGIIANSQVNGVPFSKPNNQIFPLNGATPLPNNILNNKNSLPFLAGLNGPQTSTILQNNGNNNNVLNGNSQPFVTAGQLPSGITLQKLMFGSITVIDDELTEGHELGSGVIGKAQGFYLASSLDGTSQTMVLTVLLHGPDTDHHDVEDTISFFGVHRIASPESQVAIVGGTGKYENAKGYATIATLHQENQHITDGVDTMLQFSIYLTH